ncbi:class I SAM-dependent methyltransferase [Roseivirga sp. BDSF3-8]|uniref:class I SAM-dependent methyltransferase n=1 Tax=Roseivirga sp. BDSF3-8 TaxID=3241598 RepID=UPI00353245AB
MKDLYGQALLDYQEGNEKDLWIETSYGTTEEMPVSHFFREYDGLPDIEKVALQFCQGHILDVGAGTGIHSIILQNAGNDVTSLESSALACSVIKKHGVHKILNQDFYRLSRKETYDTLLILMNGLGMAGTLTNLPQFLQQASILLAHGGQILIDSSDINYLYEDEGVPRPQGYYGELSYRYLYDGIKGEWFSWLYADTATLEQHAAQAGLECDILFFEENDQYLARLYRK